MAVKNPSSDVNNYPWSEPWMESKVCYRASDAFIWGFYWGLEIGQESYEYMTHIEPLKSIILPKKKKKTEISENTTMIDDNGVTWN